MIMKHLFSILALIATVPGAYLAFKSSCINELKRQMVGPKNPAGVGTKSVSLAYRFIAYIYVGKEAKWLELLDPISTLNQKLESDKSRALRSFFFFLLATIFALLAIFAT